MTINRIPRLCMLLAAFMLSSCDRTQSKVDSNSAQEVVLGFVDTFSGDQADFGNSVRNGIFLAINAYNSSLGPKGKQVRMIVLDDQGIPENTAKLAEELIVKHKVKSLFGASASSRSLKMAPVAQKYHVSMVTASSTHPDVTKVGDHIFRVCFIDSFQGLVMAKYLHKKGVRNVAIMADSSSEYSLILAKFFKKTFTELGGKVVLEEAYQDGQVDFSDSIKAIKEVAPEVVYIPGFYVDVAHFVLQSRQAGLKAKFAGGDGWDSNELEKLGGKVLDSSVFTSHFSSENPNQKFQDFRKRYRKKHGRAPNAFAALGYDSAGVILQAIKNAKSIETEVLREEIAATKDYPGVTGSISLDENGNAVKSAVILEIKDGKPTFLEVVKP